MIRPTPAPFDFSRFKPELGANEPTDKANLLNLALLCHLAYYQKAEVIDTLKSWGFTSCEFLDESPSIKVDSQCFIAANEQHIVVTFRGSWQWQDWLTNILVKKTNHKNSGGKVHRGFLKAMNVVLPKLLSLLKKYQTNQQKIWIVGHSLGGALANLFTSELIEHDIPVHQLITFAAPKVGNQRWSNYLNQSLNNNHFRIVNEGDPVPKVLRLARFNHAGTEIFQPFELKQKSWLMLNHSVKKAIAIFVNTAHIHNLASGYHSYIPKLIRKTKVKP